jgi:hypothetical protein
MSIVFANYDAGTHDTFNVAAVRDMYNQILTPHDEAMPTWKIYLAFKQQKELNINEQFEIPVKTHDISPAIGNKNQVFPLTDIDNITSQTWETSRLVTGAGTNDPDLVHSAGSLNYFSIIDTKVDSMHEGMTKVLNTLPFLNWNQTITSREIDISALLANQALPPEQLKLLNVSSINRLPYSLPMAARKTVTGHTYGNIATTTTTNAYWQPVVTDADGATVTRDTTAYDASDNPYTDVVTDVANPIPLDQAHLDEHLGQMQEGRQYALYAPVGRKIYRQLRDMVTANNWRSFDSPIAELGIYSYITWDEYNVVFYLEPKMNALWADSIFFFDPEAFYLCCDYQFDPTGGTGVYGWERISGTNQWGTMLYMIYQWVCADRRGVGAMHGYTSDS